MRSSCLTFLIYASYVIELCVHIIVTDAYTQSDDDIDLYDKLASYSYVVINKTADDMKHEIYNSSFLIFRSIKTDQH